MGDNSRVDAAAQALKQMMDAYVALMVGDEPVEELAAGIERISGDYAIEEVAGFCDMLMQAVEFIDPDAFVEGDED